MDLAFPRPVADMCADLAGQGFDVLDEPPGAASEPFLVLQGPVRAGGEWLEAFVLISAPHGHWSVSVRFQGMARWIPVDTWVAYLDGGEPGRPDRASLALTTRFVRDRLSEAARAFRGTPDAEQVLLRLAGRRSG